MSQWSRPYKSFMTEAERIEQQRQHDLALKKLQTLTPRQGEKTGNPPFGLGILAGLSQKPVSRPYKAQGGAAKTVAQRVAECQARVRDHIARVQANTSVPAEQKADILAKLNAKLAGCNTTTGLQKEEKDKTHRDDDPNDVGHVRQGQGQLVKQVTPGALRKNPNVLQALIDAIWAFFGGIQNRPTPVDKFMAAHPKPTTTTPGTT